MEQIVTSLKSYLNSCITAYLCVSTISEQDKESDAYKCNELHKKALEELEKPNFNLKKVEFILQDIHELILKNK